MEIGRSSQVKAQGGYARTKRAANESGSSFSDAINSQLSGERGLKDFGPNVPPQVQQAWDTAASQTGTSGLGIGENGMMTHIPAAIVLQAEQRMTTGSSDLFGSSVSSAKAMAEKILDRLNNPITPESNAKIRAYQEQEKQFYTAFIGNLGAVNGSWDGHA